MKNSFSFAWIVLSVPLLRLPGAETGDFDGDGRISIRDVVHRMNDLPPASGSLDGFEGSRCLAEKQPPFDRHVQAGLTYLESLRRCVPDPLPHWARFFSAGFAPLVSTNRSSNRFASQPAERAMAKASP